jgi:hypothetical protein
MKSRTVTMLAAIGMLAPAEVSARVAISAPAIRRGSSVQRSAFFTTLEYRRWK